MGTETLTLPGMETAVSEQSRAAAQYSGEQLTTAFSEPKGNIDTATREMELNSPLFYGTIHPTLF